MITEALFNLLFGAADLLLGFLPEFEWTGNTAVWEYLRSFISMIAYLLPWQHITAIVSLLVALGVFRIWISIIRTVESMIPFAG